MDEDTSAPAATESIDVAVGSEEMELCVQRILDKIERFTQQVETCRPADVPLLNVWLLDL